MEIGSSINDVANIDISVIVPVYKVEAYLDDCVRSILNQTFTNVEIILVDDGSPDKCPEMCDRYAEADARVRVIHKPNGGLSDARNAGLDAALGNYIMFVDSDDWIAPSMCEKLYSIAKGGNADMVICAIQNYDDLTGEFLTENWCDVLPFPKKLELKPFNCSDLNPADAVSENAPVTAWNKIYKRSFVEDNNLRFPQGLRLEDNPFYYEALVLAKRIYYTNERLYFYRVNRQGSIIQQTKSSSKNDQSAFDIIPIMKLIWDVFERNNAARLSGVLREYMVREFAWRYIDMNSNRRMFLKTIQESFSPQEAGKLKDKLKNELKTHGISAPELDKDMLAVRKVSVIVPTYNNERTIEDCVNSVLKQTLADIEVIAVNDCSTDQTARIIEDISKRDNRVILLKNERNSGPGVSRAYALENANSEYIFFLDGDDLLAAGDTLETLYNVCKGNDIHTAGGNILCFNEANETEAYQGYYFSKPCRMEYSKYSEHPTWGFTRFLYSYDLIVDNGIEFPQTRYYEDPLFLTRYMTVAREFWTIPENVYLYRTSYTTKPLSINQYRSLFPSMNEVLNNLKSVSWELYYNEYRTFLNFCYGAAEYLEDHAEHKEEICALIDGIFSAIDFSRSKGHLSSGEIFHDFSEYSQKNGMPIAPDAPNVSPSRDVSSADDVAQPVYTAYVPPVDNRKKSKSRNSFLRKAVKRMLRPAFRLYRKVVLKAIRSELYELRAGITADISAEIWKEWDDIAANITMLREDITSHIDRIGNGISSHIESASAGVSSHIDGANADVNAHIENANAGISSHIENASAGINSHIESASTGISSHIESISTGISSHIESAVTSVSSHIEGARNNILSSGREMSQIMDIRFEEMKKDLLRMNYLPMLRETGKKIFLIGTPDYGNIGDAAITLGTYAFIRQYFSDYALFELTGYQMEMMYSHFQTTIGEGDLIMLQGGGNIGDMYMLEENIRRKVIPDFPNNRIIILPQTIYFSDTLSGKRELAISKEIYGCHKRLTMFLRGNESLSFAKEHFVNADSYLAVDMAHMLDYRFGFQRKGLLLCIRDLEEESGLDREHYAFIFDTAKQFGEHNIVSQNSHDSISESERGFFLVELLKRYASAEVVVTDRLHGLVFSAVTRTPCVVMSAKTQKTREYMAFMSGGNAVFFIDRDLTALERAIQSALAVKEPIYPEFGGMFDEMREIILGDRV